MHFTPPDADLAKIFNITWDPNAWGMYENTSIYASFPKHQDPALRGSRGLSTAENTS
jgi:hypothetical protein